MRGLFVSAMLVVAITTGHAQVGDKPEAERLFEEGRRLLADGKPDEACAKFEASLLKDPRAVGTLLNLGLCKERAGKVASALKLFREAYDRANEAGLTVQRDAAQEHIAVLAAQVPHVRLAFAGERAPGTKLLVDDQVVSLDLAELPIDPGHHEVVMTAPGRLPYQTSFDIAIRQQLTLSLPVLEVPEPTVVTAGGRRLYGKLALWGGLGLTVAASGLAGYAWYRYDQLFEGNPPDCDANRVCNAHGVKVTERSQLMGNIATVVGGAGLAAAITGAILIVTSPNERRIIPTGSREQLGFVISASF